MELFLTDTVKVKLEKGKSLRAFPKFLLKDLKVYITHTYSIEEYDKLITATTGSSDWMGQETETFRFLNNTKEMAAIAVSLPEENYQGPEIDFSTADTVQGNLILSYPDAFTVSEPIFRHYNYGSGVLAAISKNIEAISLIVHPVEYSGVFGLLFSQNKYAGWMLREPERFIVNDLNFLPSGETEPRLKKLFATCMNLIAEPNVEKMENGDETQLHELINLYHKIREPESDMPQYHLLADWIYQIAEKFYSEEQVAKIINPLL